MTKQINTLFLTNPVMASDISCALSEFFQDYGLHFRICHVCIPGKKAYRQNGCWNTRQPDRDRASYNVCGAKMGAGSVDAKTFKKLPAHKQCKDCLAQIG